jgi:NAD(P)-dependent dehydrogenase (short-subunit alcohol dehydrogenase family)
MAAEGARVALVGRHTETLETAVEQVSTKGDARPYVGDVTDSSAVAAVVEAIAADLGSPDILVNNAGVTIVGSIVDIGEDDWNRQLATNLSSVYLMSRALWPGFTRHRRAAVINMASVGSVWAIPDDAGYCASKAGVLMLTKCMAVDGAADGIRVNCIIPGYVETPMIQGYFDAQDDPGIARQAAVDLHPLGRLGTSDDIAAACVYLASDDASWVTGTTLTVDGGVTAGLRPSARETAADPQSEPRTGETR